MIEIKRVINESEVLIVAELAKTIFHQFYHPQMPIDHIDFFLSEFQSTEKINEQIAKSYEYYLFNCNEESVGYLGLELKENVLVLSKLYVLDKFRNLKIGDHAIRLSKERMDSHALDKMELFVNHLNDKAIKFYEKHGFKKSKTVVNLYENGHSETDFLMKFTS